MNMFRNILMSACLAFGFGLWFGNPEEWRWLDSLGPYIAPYAVATVSFCADARPFSVVIFMALALALFMTRLKY